MPELKGGAFLKNSNKELNRYFLVAYHGTKETIVQTRLEYEEMLSKIEKYNRKNTNKYIFGNIYTEVKEDGIHVISHVYDRLSNPITISEMLDYTTKYTKEEIATIYSDNSIMKDGYIPDINIAYFQNKSKNNEQEDDVHYERRIKYVPMVYKDDKKYLSLGYIYKCIRYHADNGDYLFFRGLASELCFNKKVDKEIEDMFSIADKFENGLCDNDELYVTAKSLIQKYVAQRRKDGTYERDENGQKINSMRRILDVGMYVKYEGNMNLKKSPLKYNEGPNTYKKEELKREMEKERIKKLQKDGNYEYEQLSLF